MKAYGVRKADHGCCTGHDKYPRPSHAANPSRYTSQHGRKAHARQEGKRQIWQALKDWLWE